jgi:Transglycosylase SLT domain
MPVSKQDTYVAVGLGLLLLGGKRALAAARPSAASSPEDDGAHLVARANQAAALAWVTLFVDAGADPLLAAALARWAGIESSGNPYAVSRLGERGLFQAGPHTVEEGGLNAQEWGALTDRRTPREQLARLNAKYVIWLWHRAERYVEQPPTDPIDQVWYAKLYHQWPVDVRDGKLHGEALPMAHELATRWAGDAKRTHRLLAANVVAWGTPTP